MAARHRVGPRRRRGSLVIGVLLVLATASLVCRSLPVTNLVGLFLAVGAPYTVLCSVTALVLAVMRQRAFLSLLAFGLAVVMTAVQVTWYWRGDAESVGHHVQVRVLSSNLRKGRADAASFVELARGSADVITVSELTPEAVGRYSSAGIDEAFPYAHLVPAEGAGGIGLWSRWPIEPLKDTGQTGVGLVAVRLRVPGVKVDPVLVSTHVMSPMAFDGRAFDEWRHGIGVLKRKLDRFAEIAGSGAVIVGGDFNSTPDMRQFRSLLTGGYRDAVQESGGGFHPTFPSSKRFPPLITIDHVVTRNALTVTVRSVGLRGSDHRSLLVTLGVPVDAGRT